MLLNQYAKKTLAEKESLERFFGLPIEEIFEKNVQYLKSVAENQAKTIINYTKNSGIYANFSIVNILPPALTETEKRLINYFMGKNHHIEFVNKGNDVFVR